MEWITTTTLLARLDDFANRDVWEQFAGRFRRPIVRFARTLGLDDTDAEDVAQESLLAFAQAYREGKYDPAKGRLSKWLFGIAYRQALNARRERMRRDARLAQPAGDASTFWIDVPDEATATTMWDQEWEQSLLEQCLQQVRREVEPLTYQAFEMVVRHQRAPGDAAQELGVPIKLVYNAKHRVLKRVRELREEFDHVGARN